MSRDPDIEDDDGVRAQTTSAATSSRPSAKPCGKAGAQLAPGGVLTVTYTGDGERKAIGFNAPKLYTAAYVPAAQAAVADALGDPAPPAEVTRPPSVKPEHWDELPQAAKEALAAALPKF